MATRSKAASTRSVRQRVTMPATLAVDVRAEMEAKQQLKAAYRNFVEASEPEVKNEAGRELIRAVSGDNSIAEDSVF